MANAHHGGPNSYPNAEGIRLARLADSPAINFPERSIDGWDAADTVQRMIELDDEARALMTPEEYSESNARFDAVLAQHEERALARYRAMHNQTESSVNEESADMRTRPLDSQFGSDGNQYNPYAPHTSEEFLLQEINAGRMDPEMINTPQHPTNAAQSPLSGPGPGPSSRANAEGHVLWIPPGHRPNIRQDVNSHGVPVNISDPHEASWFQHAYGGSAAAEDMGVEDYADIYAAMPPYLDIGKSPAGSYSPYYITPDPVFPNQESPFDVQRPLDSSLGSPSLNEILALGVPRQSNPASIGRDRKRLAKPSLVVKLKTDSAQTLSQTPASLRRGRSDASSSSDSSSAAQNTQNLHPFNLRSRGSAGISSTNARIRAGWESHPVRRLTRRAEAIQSSHRKRRRDAALPQDLGTEGTIPTAGLPQAPASHSRRASTGTSEPQQRFIMRAEAPAFVPSFASTSGRTSEDIAALEAIRLTLARQMDRQATHVSSTPRPSSYLPPFRYLRTRRLVFTSELLPRNFSAQKRQAILNIFRTKAPYIPACTNMALGMPSMQYHVFYEKPPLDDSPYHAPLGPNSLGWPKDSLPLEVFHNIASHLSRDDLLQMRMVNAEFERKTSNIVFHTVVVPFRPEIYGMMIHDGPALDTKADIKGKGKAKEIYGPVEQEQTVHDGMKVFQAWGPHIKKFAMAFDVEEDQLEKPPAKGKFEFFSEFWGKYKWPHPYYNRFDFCAGLEKKADEFRCMSAALSNLQGVRELGVSIDSGLGYLCGPDISDHAQLFQEKPKIFGVSETERSLKLLERQRLWNTVVRSLGSSAATNYIIEGDTILANQIPLTPDECGYFEVHLHFPSNPHSDPRGVGPLRNRAHRVRFVDANGGPAERPLVFQGINLANTSHTAGPTEAYPLGDVNIHDLSSNQGHEKSPFHTAALIPNNLTPAQKEWLLETEWAQRAFLSSYCMALTDNSHTFQHVQSFTVAKLSSRYLSALQREDFWKALPNLNTLTINVSADWRNIFKSDSGVVEAPDIRPSGAATQFHKLLTTCIAVVPGIKNLSLGYFGGGEQQVGIFGRNKHILPAPLTNFSDHYAATSVNADILTLPNVEHLTLTNCWITPPALKTFVAQMRAANLRTLTLDSVSLTGHSGVMDNMEPNPLENGVLRLPDGPPRRFGDPAVGNLFQQRGSAPDPRSDGTGWMVESRRVGSWGNVIDAITPGPTINFLRYAYQHIHDAPGMRDSGPLERISFVSCGYVKLVNMKDFNQAFLGEVSNNPPHCLRKRAIDLMPIMMHRNDDPLLGQIIPMLHDHELEVLQTAFPMEIDLNNVTGWDNCEDGQPIGGSGRFSGHVEKLIFPTE